MFERELSGRGSKVEKDREKSRQQAKLKLAKEKRAREVQKKKQAEFDAISRQKRLEFQAKEEEREEKRLEEERLTGGIKYSKVLKAVPSTKTAGDRVTLPVSALAELDPQGVLDMKNTPLTFELCTESGMKTHAGVAEFVAEEGTIGLPPKTALSLTKGNDWSSLNQVKIRYVRLGRYPKTSASFQPRGAGFHTAGQDIVNIDIKSVLERTLHDHTTLTKGDWFPMRHDGVTYEMVVRELKPEDALSVIHTDMEVDVMMSEEAEAEDLAKKSAEERMAREAMAAVERATQALQHATEKKAALSAEPPADDVAGVVRLMVRLPDGSKQERRFLHSAKLRLLFDFVESITTSTSASTTTALCPQGSFRFRQQYPRRLLTEAEYAEKTFAEAQLNSKQEALFLEMVEQGVEEGSAAEAKQGGGDPMEEGGQELPKNLRLQAIGGGSSSGAGGARSVWEAAYARVETRVDDALAKQTNSPSPRSKLAQEAKMVAKDGDMQWAPQLRELRAMGFKDTLKNMELLTRYQGRLLRVVNVLSEAPPEEMEVDVAPMNLDAGAEGDSEDQTSPMDVNTTTATAGGSDTALAAPIETTAMEEADGTSQSGGTAGKWEKELGELADMGFVDTPQNIELLERYQGRLLRVANVLSGGD
jgi:hypothetical protein